MCSFQTVFNQIKIKDSHTVSHHQASHVRDASFQQPTVSSRLRENHVPQKESTVPWIPTSPHSPPRPWSVPPALLSIFVLHTGLYMLAPLCFPNIYVNIHLCSAVSSQPEPRCLFSPKKSPEKQKPQTRPSGSTQISPSSHDRKQAQNEALRYVMNTLFSLSLGSLSN